MAMFFNLFSQSLITSFIRVCLPFDSFSNLYFFCQSVTCHNPSLSIKTFSIEINLIFAFREMWNIDSENSPPGEFFNSFLIYHMCLLLDRYFFLQQLLSKFLICFKKCFLCFTYENFYYAVAHSSG